MKKGTFYYFPFVWIITLVLFLDLHFYRFNFINHHKNRTLASDLSDQSELIQLLKSNQWINQRWIKLVQKESNSDIKQKMIKYIHRVAALKLDCIGGVRPEGVRSELLEVLLLLKNSTSNLELDAALDQFSFCAVENGTLDLLGCNVSDPKPVASITKLAFVDFLLNNTGGIKLADLALPASAAIYRNDGTSEILACALEKTSNPQQGIDELVNKLCRNPNDRKSIITQKYYIPGFLAGGRQIAECNEYYGKMVNNMGADLHINNYRSCLYNHLKIKKITSIEEINYDHSTPQKVVENFPVTENLLFKLLSSSDSLLADKIGELVVPKKNMTVENMFINAVRLQGSSTTNVYSKLQATCKNIIEKKILRDCTSSALPNTATNNTWSTYANKIETARSLMGKTGSDGNTNTLNFAGCYRYSPQNNKILNSVSFAFFLDFDHPDGDQVDISALGQDGLDHYRSPVYNILLKNLAAKSKTGKYGIKGILENFGGTKPIDDNPLKPVVVPVTPPVSPGSPSNPKLEPCLALSSKNILPFTISSKCYDAGGAPEIIDNFVRCYPRGRKTCQEIQNELKYSRVSSIDRTQQCAATEKQPNLTDVGVNCIVAAVNKKMEPKIKFRVICTSCM